MEQFVKLVRFDQIKNDGPVAINPECVATVERSMFGHSEIAVITLRDGREFRVIVAMDRAILLLETAGTI